MSLLIKNGCVLTMDEQNTIHSPGWVWIGDDQIGQLGAGHPPDELSSSASRVIDATGKAILPGMINGHTHLSQTFMRGLARDQSLTEWLKVIHAVQSAMTSHDMWLASLLGLVENVRCGVTALIQHHKVTTSPEHVDVTARAAQLVGLRMQLARGWHDLGDAGEEPESIIHEMSRLREQWHNSASGRITIGFGPMVPGRCSEATMRRTVALARDWGVAIHIHVAETRSEVELHRRRIGMGHIEWLQALGALGPNMQLVHCVWINDVELDLIAKSGAIVIHCPVSNMYLASGIAPVQKMLDKGIPVALGTDGSASNNSQDLLETMKIAGLLAKVGSGDAAALKAEDVLRMVSITGSRLFSRQSLGRIVVGAKADITIVNLNTVRCMPVHCPKSALIFGASGPDVDTVIVDGRILLDACRVTTLDEAALLAECHEAAARVLNRAGVMVDRSWY